MTHIDILEHAQDYVGIHYINGVEEAYISPCLLRAIAAGIEAIRAQQKVEKSGQPGRTSVKDGVPELPMGGA